MTLSQNPPAQQVSIHHADMGGWLRFFSDPQASAVLELPVYLSYTVTQWFRARPQYRLRFILPITRGGNTVELHVWYEQHLFPDQSGVQVQPAQPKPA
jgi:hypothetical protein